MHIFVLNNPSLGLYSDLFIKLTYSFLNTISEFRLVEIESSLEIQYKYVNEAIITGLIQYRTERLHLTPRPRHPQNSHLSHSRHEAKWTAFFQSSWSFFQIPLRSKINYCITRSKINHFRLLSSCNVKSIPSDFSLFFEIPNYKERKRCQVVGVIWRTWGYTAFLWRTVTAS